MELTEKIGKYVVNLELVKVANRTIDFSWFL